MTEQQTVAWHHFIPGVCNHVEYHYLNGCHRQDGEWRRLVYADQPWEPGPACNHDCNGWPAAKHDCGIQRSVRDA